MEDEGEERGGCERTEEMVEVKESVWISTVSEFGEGWETMTTPSSSLVHVEI